MGSESGAFEPDAGARYPTLFQDTNGNQIRVTYLAEAGGFGESTSARLSRITDIRADAGSRSCTFYQDPETEYLQSISAKWVGGTISFTYCNAQALSAPWGGAGAGAGTHA